MYAAVTRHFAFMTAFGFHRARELEASTSTGASVVLLGRHVAVEISLDLRDSKVDVQVAAARAGVITRNHDGGYSSDLFMHLVNREHYRGGMEFESNGSIDDQVRYWAELLSSVGQRILADEPSSLETT